MAAGNSINNKLEVVTLKQVASLCCVSEDRVKKWVNKRGLKPLTSESEQVYCQDLIDFLVQYNMPIPASILPAEAKKILFIFSSETLKYIYVTFLVHFFQKLRTEENFISDTVCYDQQAKYKILTFAPDLIVTYTISAHDNALQLIRFAKKNGGCRVLSIVEKNISRENKTEIRSKQQELMRLWHDVYILMN
ncbi:MAG: hypothetical protein JRJ37_11770 [Deltaproteobacteria bacterium]|nr:hypothetical protein [Deltaproteobacteria bacterium]